MPEKEPFGYEHPRRTPEEITADLDRVDELVSGLLDENLSTTDFDELEKLLHASESSRARYAGMMQLHVDLADHFQSEDAGASEKSPALGFLGTTSDMPVQPQD